MGTTREILEPRWQNESTKDTIIAKFRYTDDDGAVRTVSASITNPDGTNPDWAAVVEQFGIEGIDANTTARIEQIAALNAEREERRLRENERMRQERVFEVKLQLFESPHVSNSDDLDRKREIRRSQTEVTTTLAVIDLMIAEAFKRAGIDLPAANTTWETSE